jgi:signal transduction histidine kinase
MNIERHASAETVLLQVAIENHTLSVEIEDDGTGFEPLSIEPSSSCPRGLGLQGMRERVELLGGTFSLTSAPHHGTRIAITVPT